MLREKCVLSAKVQTYSSASSRGLCESDSAVAVPDYRCGRWHRISRARLIEHSIPLHCLRDEHQRSAPIRASFAQRVCCSYNSEFGWDGPYVQRVPATSHTNYLDLQPNYDVGVHRSADACRRLLACDSCFSA